MLYALVQGGRLLRRSFGLAVLLLVVNVAAALVLAAPLAGILQRDLHQKQASRSMLYGFDYPWWSQWSDAQSGWTTSFGPEIFGVGFVFRNLDLLLKGALPANLLAPRGGGAAHERVEREPAQSDAALLEEPAARRGRGGRGAVGTAVRVGHQRLTLS